jgi:phosphoribosylformylglycinamidine (FGAM) synthase-like enzyme
MLAILKKYADLVRTHSAREKFTFSVVRSCHCSFKASYIIVKRKLSNEMKIQYGTDEKFRRYIKGGISQMKRQFRGSIKIFHNHTLAARKNILRLHPINLAHFFLFTQL